jgi:hypothetical protein
MAEEQVTWRTPTSLLRYVKQPFHWRCTLESGLILQVIYNALCDKTVGVHGCHIGSRLLGRADRRGLAVDIDGWTWKKCGMRAFLYLSDTDQLSITAESAYSRISFYFSSATGLEVLLP